MSQENYLSYQGMLTTVTTGVAELGSVCTDLAMTEQADALTQVRDRLQNHVFSVGIMGEFRRGKSTVINALLEQNIVPADIVPTSATLNYVRWSPNKNAEIHFKDGKVQTVGVDELSNYVTKITPESEEMAKSVDYAVVNYPCTFCQNGVQIVDTPGLNDDERMTAISESIIPTLDAIIMVLVPGSPFSQSEAEFVRNKVMASDLGRIIFVVNKIDTVDEDERDRLLQHIKEKIQSSVLEKMEAVYGKESDEYKNAKAKLGEIKLLPISARNALKGKMKNDREKWEESGYPEFEAMLSKLLTEERGILELIHPINKIGSASKEAVSTIEMRVNAMRMEAAEFEKVHTEALETIRVNREKKREEIQTLKAKGKTLYVDLLPELGQSYTQMEEEISQYIAGLVITEDDIKSEDSLKTLSDEITPMINQQIEDVLSVQTERLLNRIHTQLGDDVRSLEQFGQTFAADMAGIQTELSIQSSAGKGTSNFATVGIGTIAETLALFGGANLFGTVLPGVGGLIAGWREHGLKGAAVGGLSGLGISLLTTFAISSLGVVGLPLAMIVGLTGSFGGRAITNLIFGKKTVKASLTPDAVRSQLRDSTIRTIGEMQAAGTLEKWLRDTCDAIYEGVAADIDRELDSTLSMMEHNFAQIQADLKKNEEDKQRIEGELAAQAEKVRSILAELEPVRAKVTGVN